VSVGEAVVLAGVKLDNQASVLGIEVDGKPVDQAVAGAKVGITLSVKLDDVARGQVGGGAGLAVGAASACQ
jgi:translation elongation factor EF-Tu-like GTPase